MRAGHAASLVLAVAGLSACNRSPEPIDPTELDPMVQRALNDPIMADPDLVSQNMANAALAFEVGQPLPLDETGQVAIIAAREDALMLVGGSSGLKPLPEAQQTDGLTAAEALNSIGRAQRLAPTTTCANAARFSAIWAARLPEPLSIYPRGSTKESIGADTAGCRLRSVIYITPVPLDDVIAFHHTRVVGAGLATDYFMGEGWRVLSGNTGTLRYEIAARSLPTGQSEVSIASLETD
ncbi:hypothetical protein [Parerythrobacter lacustris]|uniref:YjbF family lipoprotein n=1 Tax=Parerythrobacter lacustris TaxID=2969984 RepID=A0ABT1XTZ8_9SPHN|nr:hypothetical protein [Parerythrobacter lacustris]MCR2835134.1 hypothetical protein [Parerythrobacter lacustris]